MRVVGLDLGTARLKGAAYRPDGTLLAAASRPLTMSRPSPGRVEQDPEEWWRAVQDVLADLGPADALAICAQINTHVFLDSAGRPLRRAISWADGRAAEIGRAASPPLGAGSAEARYRWLQANEPELASRVRWIALPKDYINFRLTGTIATDPAAAPDLMAEGAYRPSIPPDLRALLPPIMRETALVGRAGSTPVACGTMDGVAAIYGCGDLSAGTAFDVSGTSETVGILSRERSRPPGIRAIIPMPAHYLHGGPTQAGGGSVAWALRACAPNLTWDTFFEAAEGAQPGANRLIFLPYLLGERAPLWDPDARGGFFGLSLAHTQADLCRAVLEGVAFAIRHLLETIESGLPERAAQIFVCGGGARPALWNRIKADVTGRTVCRPDNVETGTLGAAMIAAVAAGAYAELDAAIRGMRPPFARLEPGAERARYDALYGVYRTLYPALRESFARLAAIPPQR